MYLLTIITIIPKIFLLITLKYYQIIFQQSIKIRTNNITPNIRRSIKIKKLKIITKINYSNSK